MQGKEQIYRLRKLIDEEILLHYRKHVHAKEISGIIDQVSDIMLTGYDAQRSLVPALLSLYEDNADHIIGLMIPNFLDGMNKLKELKAVPLDLSFWDAPFDFDSTIDEFLEFYKSHLSKGEHIRLSKDVPVTIDLATAGRFLRLIHKLISPVTVKSKLTADEANAIIMQLWIGRNIARAINRKELFYFLASIFLDTLHFQQNYQFARDVAEECLICGYNDEMPAYGYYLSFKVFSSTSSSVSALHYATIANKCFLKGDSISDYLLKNYYWESIKFFRNLLLIPFAISLFKERPQHVIYSDYEQNKFHHAYYSSLFYLRDKELPSLILGYIDKNKEQLMSTGEHEVLPWLTMLFNVKKNYSTDEYDDAHLQEYVELFKRVVSPENYDRFYKSLFGSVEDLSKELKESLLRLTFTRNPSDFVTDNKVALQVSHRNILESHKLENIEGYLLSMILQSDFSIVFKDKETELLNPIHNSYIEKDFEKEYYTPTSLKQSLLKRPELSILWLGTDNHETLPLLYEGGEFRFLKDREISLYDVIVFSKEIVSIMPLRTRTEGRNSHEKLFEDYKQEEDIIRGKASILLLPLKPTSTLLVIKDITLSAFPHNMQTSEDGFVCNSVPVANIMSLEWFMENQSDTSITKPSKAIWIPVESRDIAIEMMYSKMEESIKDLEIIEYKKIIPESPLRADINILVAHGSESISTFPALYLSDDTKNISIRSFDHIVDMGKILILFVCHSGSEKSDLYRNQTLAVVKQFLQNGYKAVIAPFWGLHIEIPPLWLPEFFLRLAAGFDIGYSVFYANRKVAETFNTPNAYACLHLYGNPFIRIIS